MPVILATQEAKIRRIAVQSQPGQIVCENFSQKHLTYKKCWHCGSNDRVLLFKFYYCQKIHCDLKKETWNLAFLT
jgi:hypothetical protein